jgi:hypothetical protein
MEKRGDSSPPLILIREENEMERREFFVSMGTCGLCAGLASALGLTSVLVGQEKAAAVEPPAPSHPLQERMDFAESWVKNFMGVLDDNLDAPTRARVMEANGRACAQAYMKTAGIQIKPVTFDQWLEKIKTRPSDGTIRVEGRTIHYQYLTNYQGKPAPEGSCLCPLVETKPAGLSGTYCHCSVGYIKEFFGRTFGQPVTVELVSSTLRGGKRCQFKIDLA